MCCARLAVRAAARWLLMSMVVLSEDSEVCLCLQLSSVSLLATAAVFFKFATLAPRPRVNFQDSF